MLRRYCTLNDADFSQIGHFLADARDAQSTVHQGKQHAAGGASVVTNGPYAEAQEVLAGYWITWRVRASIGRRTSRS